MAEALCQELLTYDHLNAALVSQAELIHVYQRDTVHKVIGQTLELGIRCPCFVVLVRFQQGDLAKGAFRKYTICLVASSTGLSVLGPRLHASGLKVPTEIPSQEPLSASV